MFVAPDLLPAAAEIFLLSAICVVLLVDLFLKDSQRQATYYLAMLSLAGTAATIAAFGVDERTLTFAGSYVADPAGDTLKLFACLAVAFAFLYSRQFLTDWQLFRGEFYVLGLFGLLGVMVMISAHSMLTMYLGLELLSLSLYALVAFNRESAQAAEAAMKYFVLGAIASGTLLYGISILYGTTGTLEFNELAAAVGASQGLNLPLLLGLAFVLVGIAFKFGAVPFHMWLPDVYQGAPIPVTLYVGTAPKIAAFALTWRVLIEGLGGMQDSWQDMLVVLAVLSMGIGNIVAIAQTNIKRMLAYSTISHVGFILLGFLAGSDEGLSGAMFYTVTYVIMASGAFGMVIFMSRAGFEAEQLADFKGLNARSPWFALVMLLIMFSMAGVPPLLGFYAKLVVLAPVIEAGFTWLAALAVLFSVIGAFYYLRVVWYMYFDEPVERQPLVAGPDLRFAVSLNGVALLALGLFPGGLLDLCARVLS